MAFFGWLAATPSFGDDTVFDCIMEPTQLVKVGSPVVGILDAVVVKRGDLVESGQVIARLKSEIEAATVEINRTRSASTARIKARQARVTLSRKKLQRATALLKKQVVSADRYDELQAELEFAENELARHTLEYELAQLEYARSEIVLDQRTVRSPIRGVITERALSAGEFVQQEGHIITVAALDPLNVEVFLPVDFFPKISKGMVATVEPAAPINGTYDATVIVVDRVFDAASSSFGVRLSLTNDDGKLPGGHRCKVTFPLE